MIGVGIAEAVIVFIAMALGMPTLIPLFVGASFWLLVGA